MMVSLEKILDEFVIYDGVAFTVSLFFLSFSYYFFFEVEDDWKGERGGV